MKNQEKRFQWVQAKMKDFDIAAYIVPTADYHQVSILKYFTDSCVFKQLYRLNKDIVVLSESIFMDWRKVLCTAEKQLEGKRDSIDETKCGFRLYWIFTGKAFRKSKHRNGYVKVFACWGYFKTSIVFSVMMLEIWQKKSGR